MNKVLSQAIKKAVSEYSPTKIDTNKEKRLDLFSLTMFLLNNSGLNFLENFIYPTRCIYSFFIGQIYLNIKP